MYKMCILLYRSNLNNLLSSKISSSFLLIFWRNILKIMWFFINLKPRRFSNKCWWNLLGISRKHSREISIQAVLSRLFAFISRQDLIFLKYEYFEKNLILPYYFGDILYWYIDWIPYIRPSRLCRLRIQSSLVADAPSILRRSSTTCMRWVHRTGNLLSLF